MNYSDKDFYSNIDQIIDSADKNTIFMSAGIAEIVINDLDPDKTAPPLIRFGCFRHIEQLARKKLRKTYEPDPNDMQQIELLPDLQDRYSVKRNTDEGIVNQYIPRHMLTYSECMELVSGFEEIGNKFHRKADALRTFAEELAA